MAEATGASELQLNFVSFNSVIMCRWDFCHRLFEKIAITCHRKLSMEFMGVIFLQLSLQKNSSSPLSEPLFLQG